MRFKIKQCFLPKILLIVALILSHGQQLIAANEDTNKKVYKVGLPIIPGFMGIDEEGEVVGFPLELFVELAALDSIQYEWITGSWSELFDKLKKSEIDVMPGTQISEERKEYLDFMDEDIYSMWSELYTLGKTNFLHLNELSGRRIGLVRGDNNGSGFDEYIRDFNIEYVPVFYDSHKDVIEGLKQKEIFAFSGPSAKMMGHYIKEVRSTGLFYNPTSSNFAFSKGENKALRIGLSNRLSELKRKPGSVYFELYQKYGFSSVPTTETTPFWVKLVLIIGLFTIIIVIGFVVLLRREVFRKTIQLKQREANLKERAVYLSEAMTIGKMGTWGLYTDPSYFLWSKEIFYIIGVEPRTRVTLLETLRTIHVDDRVEAIAIYRKILKGMKGFDVEIRMLKPNGTIIYTKQVGVVIKGEHNEPERILGIMQDITSQKIHEHDLLKAKDKAEESERLKTAFLANMSHEIRTPLNAIIGFTELMATTQQTPESRMKYSEIVLDQNTLLLKLIDDVLDIAKIESGLIKINIEDSVDVIKVVTDVYESRLNRENNEVKFKLNIELVEDIFIKTDKLRLQQILYNFVVNAFKYTKKGSVEIGCRLNAKKEVMFFVKDTGEGIQKELQSSIFERFQQVDSMKQGAGLGLPISKSLAALLGGRILLDSEVDKGSEFQLILPLDSVEKA